MQHCQGTLLRQQLFCCAREMLGCKVRFTKQNEDRRLWMSLAYLGNFRRGVAVACPNPAQVFSGHAVESVKALGVIAGSA